MMAAIDFTTAINGVTLSDRVALAATLGLGLVLWIFGRRMVRPVCALMGLLIGGLAGLIASHHLAGAWTPLLTIGLGAIVGLAAAISLFRLWMGLSLALVLATALPTASLIWQETAPAIAPASSQHETPDNSPEPDAAERSSPRGRIDALYHRQADRFETWWSGLTDGDKIRTLTLAAIGGGLGLFIGIVFPYLGASIQSALAGALLIFASLQPILLLLLPRAANYWPAKPHQALVAVSLITLAGVFIQWTISKHKADK